jgi:hypothetical protein
VVRILIVLLRLCQEDRKAALGRTLAGGNVSNDTRLLQMGVSANPDDQVQWRHGATHFLCFLRRRSVIRFRPMVDQEAFFGQATTLLLSITHILEPPG